MITYRSPIALILFFITTVTSQGLITGQLDEDQYIIPEQQYDISGYTDGSTIQIQFRIMSNHPLSPTFLVISDEPLDQEYDDIKYYFSLNPRQPNNFDLDAMWQFRDQYINIKKQTGKNKLFYTVINFDDLRLYTRNNQLQFQIQFGIDGLNNDLCAACENEGDLTNRYCICRNCDDDFTGKICSRRIIDIEQEQQQFELQLQPYQMKYYRIPPNQIQLNMLIDRGLIECYIQLQEFNDQVATFYNVAVDSQNRQARFQIINDQDGQTVTISSSQKYILITFANLIDQEVEVLVTYASDQTVSVLVIVMSILGGLLLVGLIIAAVCIIKRNRQASGRVSTQLNLPSQSNKLNAEEIQRFFPSSTLSSIVGSNSPGEASMNQMKSNQIEKLDLDCVICLQQIKDEDLVRIGYCRHIFHSNCLIGWFKKQRNCPYCRKQYTRDNTKIDYEKLCNDCNRQMLKDTQLLMQIYKSKPSNIPEKMNIQVLQ